MNGSNQGCCNECTEKSKFPSISKLQDISLCIKQLTELDLRSSNIDKVPELIKNLVNIVKLDLSSNELNTLPQDFTKFEHLTDLNLSHNKFLEVPQCLINGMYSITTLDLSHNQLLDISKKPFCIRRLMTLNISHNSKLNSFPRWFWSIDCNSLESLDLSFTNCLDNIDVDPYLNMYGIGKHLKYLNVSNTNSDVLKLDFVKHLKKLMTLVLDNKYTLFSKSYNFLSNVPLCFNNRFKCVESLSMSNVSLSRIGKNVYFSLPNLRFLNLSNNFIATLPDSFSELKNLEFCDFSNNQLFIIPESFKYLNNLKKLVLNNNWISTFPTVLKELSNLEFLDLYSNKLVACPLWNLNSNIKSLDLEQNEFSTENNLDENLKENYSILLKNLRSSINDKRNMGPIDVNETIDVNENDESSKWSMCSTSEHSLHEESQEYTNFNPEELWECGSYEFTTDLFDPKEFELNLMDELIKEEKLLTSDNKIKENNIFRNAVRLSNEHYFCPSDELPRFPK